MSAPFENSGMARLSQAFSHGLLGPGCEKLSAVPDRCPAVDGSRNNERSVSTHTHAPTLYKRPALLIHGSNSVSMLTQWGLVHLSIRTDESRYRRASALRTSWSAKSKQAASRCVTTL